MFDRKAYCRVYIRAYYLTNKNKIKKQVKAYYLANREKTLKQKKEYRATSVAKKLAKKWRLAHNEYMKEKEKDWRRTHPEQRRKINKKYFKSPKGKEADRRHRAKRKKLGFIPLNKWRPGLVGHHVDTKKVIYMPRNLHESIWHSLSQNWSMQKINSLAFGFLRSQKEQGYLNGG